METLRAMLDIVAGWGGVPWAWVDDYVARHMIMGRGGGAFAEEGKGALMAGIRSGTRWVRAASAYVRPTETIGTRLRAARLRQRLPLREVASKAGITVSALSQLERDRLHPTVGTLKSVASALNITIGSLFADTPTEHDIVVRAAQRKVISPRQGITYELLTADLSGQIEFCISVYEEGVSSGEDTFAYSGEHCGLLLEGTADIQVGDTVHRLHAGDSIRFDCSLPHRIVNAGPGQMRLLWAITPPSF